MIQHSDHVTLMIDSSRFDKQAFSLIAAIDEIDEIITDSLIDQKSIKTLEKRNISVTIVETKQTANV